MTSSRIGRPSSCGPATLVDNTVRSAMCLYVATAHSPQTLALDCVCHCTGFLARPGPHATRHTTWCAMCGHVWHHAGAAARGRGQGRAGAGVVPISDDARREHVGHELGLSAPARGARLQLRRAAGCAAAAFRRVWVSAAVAVVADVRGFLCGRRRRRRRRVLCGYVAGPIQSRDQGVGRRTRGCAGGQRFAGRKIRIVAVISARATCDLELGLNCMYACLGSSPFL